MIEIELEKTYLAKKLPKDLEKFPHREIIDLYIPAGAEHPVLRIRKKGDKFEITKKQPISGGDSSEQEEHTIRLTEEEYNSLCAVSNKKVQKIRYNYKYGNYKAEIGVFKGDLAGLVLIDFEFTNQKEKNAFQIPNFCLVDVTQEAIFAGGMLCGKKYADIEGRLKELGYGKIVG